MLSFEVAPFLHSIALMRSMRYAQLGVNTAAIGVQVANPPDASRGVLHSPRLRFSDAAPSMRR